jgi:hypothetical protein
MVFAGVVEAAASRVVPVGEPGQEHMLSCRILGFRSLDPHRQDILETGHIAKGLGRSRDRYSLAVLDHHSS